MRLFPDLPIKRKLTLVVLLTCGVVLLLACAALFAFQIVEIKRSFTRDLTTLAQIMARNTTAAVAFADKQAAEEALSALSAKPDVVYACITLKDRSLFAHYGTIDHDDDLAAFPRVAEARAEGNHILVAQPIVLEAETVGMLYLRADFGSTLRDLVKLYGSILTGVLVASLGIAFLLSGRFQRFITDPILKLAQTAEMVAQKNDYSLRAAKTVGDEVGAFTDAFNLMLARIERQNTDLRREITERHKAEAGLARLASIMEATTDFVGSFDVHGHILYLNRAARRMCGLAVHADVTGKLMSDNHPEASQKIIAEQGLPAAARDGAWTGETFLLGGDGQSFPLSQVIIAHKTPAGELAFFSTVARDISEQKKAEAEMKRLNLELVDIEVSRRAGMAEVATGVLHNVGNVLNSVNVSTTIVAEKIRKSSISNLVKTAALLRENEADMVGFLTSDSRGRKLPPFIVKLAEVLEKERCDLAAELDSLIKNITHIKDIVAMQQNYARVSGVIESLSLSSLIEDALDINSAAFVRHGVAIERDFGETPKVLTDKHSILQILINLIGNAKYAVAGNEGEKHISVQTRYDGNGHVTISVKDNGIGIAAENLTKIFSHGFTTKKDGHGFGLHSGANAAREMGGSLSAQSEGPGKGATFVLEVPLKHKKNV